MRRLGDGVEAAMHCALVLAGLPDGAVIPGRDLAVLYDLSESYLLKHLRALTAAGVTEATSGPRGGYRLARDPANITMLDVVEAIDGPGPAFVCREIRQCGPVASKEPCNYKKNCLIRVRMLQAEKLWRDSLRGQTLADLARDAAPMIDETTKRALAAYVDAAKR
ncbi:RrF2 family transcriptional regulator [Camelimonas fluminis]|uniref:RrF2 family transcriptional regulator n=1 Tax=Camelimonas fluminis TaxID=1576911 RepID=A0ABV7UJ43_9HYPH|nr:Rrf2 family transcriptional regulator [Camelimonas fluminis]